MPTVLDQIMSRTLLTVMDRKQAADIPALERKAALHLPRGFHAGVRKAATQGPAVIAELKKASPSKGLLRGEDYRPAAIAQSYEKVGAAAISVLTDEEFFKGSLDDLAAVSAVVKIPVLRKDFMLDAFQILEARAAGADAILLIVAAHTDRDLKELNAEALRMNLDVLCEVHDREELNRAVDLGVEMIGVGGAGGGERREDCCRCRTAAGGGVRRVPGGRGADAAARSGSDARAADGEGLRVGVLRDQKGFFDVGEDLCEYLR
jgi:indole-3-glycerol phosphate synthase